MVIVSVQELHHPPGVARLQLETELPARAAMHHQKCCSHLHRKAKCALLWR